MKRKIYFLALILISGIIFDSCKRGEEDPFISLRSRDNRITADWQLKTYDKVTSSTNDGITTTTTYSYDGTTLTKVRVNDQGTTTDTYSFSYELNIIQDGSYVSTVVDNGDKTQTTSNWWWSNTTENKAGIVMEYDGTYLIERLAFDELTLSADEFETNTQDGITDSTRTTFLMTFIKK
jgi:archaellum component FlaF (FlaF/FlaG flagellin family)